MPDIIPKNERNKKTTYKNPFISAFKISLRVSLTLAGTRHFAILDGTRGGVLVRPLFCACVLVF